jgi:hypothetical protein
MGGVTREGRATHEAAGSAADHDEVVVVRVVAHAGSHLSRCRRCRCWRRDEGYDGAGLVAVLCFRSKA